jgi:glycosyltransferase involved in cell wall biosynthesis
VDITICGTVSRLSNVGKASHYRHTLHKLIGQRRLEHSITMASDLSPDDEQRFLLTTDILVLPYLDCDTLAMSSVLVKGLAAGCAVVVSDVKAFSEVIEHGRNGLLVPPHDPRALAQYLSYLIGQRHEIARLGTEARLRSERCNSWPVVTGRMTEIYTQVLERMPQEHDRTSP